MTLETGSEILHRTAKLSQPAREEEFLTLIARGNVPSGTWGRVRIGPGLYAMPDFLAVGTDADFVWAPLTPRAAVEAISPLGFRLPTRAEADAVFKAALEGDGFLPFRSFTPRAGHTRYGSAALEESRAKINAALRGRVGLLDGHKKYVLGRTSTGRVIIYGGHTDPNTRVQPYSTIHSETYLDYSHGIRGVVSDP